MKLVFSRQYQLVLLLMLLLIAIASCKSSANIPVSPSAPVSSPLPQGPVEQQVSDIKSSILHPLSSQTAQQIGNTTSSAVNTADVVSKNVLVPSVPQIGEGTIYIGYVSNCWVRNWKVLNIYCSGKDFWHNQSTLLSWYIGYSIVLLLLIIAILWIWHLYRKMRG